MKKLLPALLALLPFSAFSQVPPSLCTGYEQWISANAPATVEADLQRPCLTVMNNELYAINWNSPRALHKFDGTTWTQLGSVDVNGIYEYAFYGWNNSVFLGGFHYDPNNIPNADGIVEWDGTQWKALTSGAGLAYNSTQQGVWVSDMIEYNGNLIICGTFTSADGLNANNIVGFDGNSYFTLGTGLDSTVTCLEVMNGELYAGGFFQNAGGVNSPYLAKWNGTNWISVTPSLDREVGILRAYHGKLLVVSFYSTTPIHGIGWYDNGTWTQVNANVGNNYNHLEVSGGSLYTTGYLYDIEGVAVQNIARFDGTQWHPVTSIGGNIMNDIQDYNGVLFTSNFDGSNTSCGASPGRIAYLCDMGNCGSATGTLYLDDNQNCAQDGADFGLAHRIIEFQPGIATITNANGTYAGVVPAGTYSVQPNALPGLNTACPATGSYTANITASQSLSGLDFGMHMPAPVADLQALTQTNRIRPGWPTRIYASYRNAGYYPENGIFQVTLPASLTPTAFSATPVSTAGNVITWNYTNLTNNEVRSVWIEVLPDTTLQQGDTVCISADINIPAAEITPGDNYFRQCIEVTAAYDPNDKAVDKGPDLYLGDDILTYTIRFQNTGNDTAMNVRIQDMLDADLDWSSFELVGSSHTCTPVLYPHGLIVFRFDQIYLPDSNVNEPASHGFITYRMRLKPALPMGTVITNTADIYFDYNAPVTTNTTTNTVTGLVSNESSPIAYGLRVWPNPAQDVLNIDAPQPISWTLIDAQGKTLDLGKFSAGVHAINLREYAPGMYLFRTMDPKGFIRVIKVVKI